jgi:SAM-dependent methyltransferase
VGKRARKSSNSLPPVGNVRFGDFRRLTPLSRCYGYDRGRPIDRYYIENFLESESEHIRGNVLEIGENTYTRKFGKGVSRSDVLHVSEEAAGATYVDDLSDGSTLPSNEFDCVILTQTLHLIYDMKAALATIYRILKPGGALLATVPGITQISDEEWNDTWYWSLTTNSAKRLCAEVFAPQAVHVNAFGNVLAASSFLQGLADSELTRKELDYFDPEYPVTVTIKAVTAYEGFRVQMVDGWNYADKDQLPYDEETSYRKGISFLDGRGKIEDWGCGTAFAKRFVSQSEYVGIDGSVSKYVDVVADLQHYASDTECIFMRHVLEHNWGWRSILRNAVNSFRHRMALVVFTPFGDSEMKLLDQDGIPDLALNKTEVLSYFNGLSVTEERIQSNTQYGEETIFYIERQGHATGID